MRKWLYPGVAVMLLLSALGTSGCSGGTEGSPFLEMLKLIPDTHDTRWQVYISDHARIREIHDIALPSSDADAEVLEEYVIALAGDISDPHRLADCSFICGFGPRQYALVSPIRRQHIGFGPLDVDVDISAGLPPLQYEAAKGDFNLAAIEDALSQYDESVLPDVDSYHDNTLYIWSYVANEVHLDRRLEPPIFDNLGRGTTLAVQKDYICSQDTPEMVKTMIDASQGEVTSLADNSDFSLMATALSEMGAYSCYLSDQVMCVDNNSLVDLVATQIVTSDMTVEEARQQFLDDIVTAAAGELLSFYRTYATGIGADDEGPFMTMVFIYDSPEQASSNVDVFKQQIESGFSVWTDVPWQDMVASPEVWAEGRSLRVKLRGDIVFDWTSIIWARETLLWCSC